MEQRIIIRHLGKTQMKVDEFSIDSFVDLTFGREAACQIHYDDQSGELVSRRHARLAIASRDPLQLALTDLGSRNGTFVNGQRIQGEVRISPGDRVQLGTGGPEFQVDVSPQIHSRETAELGVAEAATKVVAMPPVTSAKVQRPIPPIPAPPAPVPARTTGSARKALLFVGLGLMAAGLALAGVWLLAGRGGKLSVKVYTQKTIMTVAYKAYGNSEAGGGKYWFAKLVLKNTGRGPLRNVKASYQIPDYLPWSTPDEAPEILPGETVVLPIYPKLPAKITSIRTRTPSQFEIKIEYDDGSGVKSMVEKREFEFRGITEFEWTSLPENEVNGFFDVWDNNPLVSAFVTVEDPAVKLFLAKISETCGGVTIITSGEQLSHFGECVYNYMVSLGMTYSGDEAIGEKNGDVLTTLQSIRLPRDVIYGDSGLCVELAILWSAIGEAAGIHTYIVLIPHHSFPIIESGDGTQIAVEATSIGGAAANMPNGAILSWVDSTKMANKELQDAQRDGRIIIVDPKHYQDQGIRPPELADINRPELANLLDDLRARHGRHPQAAVTAARAPVPRGGAVPMPQQGAQVWRDPGGQIAFSYPGNWVYNAQAVGSVRTVLPTYAFAAADPGHRAGVDVAFFNARTVEATFQQYSMALSRLGIRAQTGQAQRMNLGGREVMVTPIQIAGPGYASAGMLYVARVRTGFVIVGATALQPGVDQWLPVLQRIGASLQFGN